MTSTTSAEADAERTVPMIFDVDGLVQWFRNRGTPVTTAEFMTAAVRVGRNDEPALLFDLYYTRTLRADVMTTVILDAWSSPEWPTRCVDPDIWRDWFTRTGFVVDNDDNTSRPADRPDGPVTLYRGATDAAAAGWSWTSDLDVARKFARMLAHHFDRDLVLHPAHVWVASVPPAALLGRIDHGRGEAEWIVDPDLLEPDQIKRLETPLSDQ